MKPEQQHASFTQSTGSIGQQRRGKQPSAIRMACLRERRERGFRVYQIEVCDADIESLIARGFLDRLDRSNADATERAIGAVLDRLRG